MIALALLRAPLYHLLKLGGVIARAGLPSHVEMRLYHIVHILQHHRRALLYAFGRCNVRFAAAFFHYCFKLAAAHNILDLVTPYICKAYRRTHIDFVYVPSQPRVPQYCFNYAPRCRRSHHIVTHALRFKLGSAEAGVVAPYFYPYRQDITPFAVYHRHVNHILPSPLRFVNFI